MKDNKGISTILVIVSIISIIATAGFFLLRTPRNQENSQPSAIQGEQKEVEKTKNTKATDEPPLKLKSIGVEFSDFKFTKQKLQFGKPFMEFGFYIPGGDQSHPAKNNPQPTFVVPLGTPVRSLVDGVVANIGTLWSGDVSIQVTSDGKMQKWIYETEHVKNPLVKVGDRVKAGQVIAEVSDFDKGNSGLGAVEIGILKGGNPPKHICPFAYLDDSIKTETLAKIKKLFKDWEEYIGDQTLYDESMPIPGCLTTDEIKG